jgi:hypothetical protein
LVQDNIETAFLEYTAGRDRSTIDVRFPGGPEIYQINFLKGLQTNTATNVVRNIKCE